MLGRASNIGDYVKRGEESGWVKLTLRGASPGQILVITRKINKQNKSDWLLDGEHSWKVGVYKAMIGGVSPIHQRDVIDAFFHFFYRKSCTKEGHFRCCTTIQYSSE